MTILIDDRLQSVLAKLRLCADPQTGSQLFFGMVRVTIDGDDLHVDAEDLTWETEGGRAIDTSLLKEPQ